METTKQKSLRTLLCVFLSLVLAVTMTPLPAYANDAVAAEGEAGGDQTTASAEIAVPIPQGKTLAYTGDWQLGIDPAEGWSFACADGEAGHFDAKAGCWKMNAGNHACTLHLDEGYVWENGSRNDITVDWSIQAKAITAPEGLQLTANGQAQQGVSAGEGYNLSGDTEATEAGSYVATATLLPNYVWDDGTTEPKQIAWSIVADEQAVEDEPAVEDEAEPAEDPSGEDGTAEEQDEDPEASAQALTSVDIPVGGTFYAGSWELEEWFYMYFNCDWGETCGIWQDESIVAIAINYDDLDPYCYYPGTYRIIYQLEDGYCWSDGTTDDKSISLKIKEDADYAEIDIRDCTIKLSFNSCIYNGKAKKPTVTVKGEKIDYYWNGSYYEYEWLDYATLEKGVDYTVSYSNNIKAGTATVTIKGIGDYYGTVKKTFAIVPASNGWFKTNNTWYYKTQSGLASGWKSIGGVWYYFNPTTKKMSTGLKTIEGKKYYFNKSGAMQSSCWKSINGSWYYFSSSGAAKSGWLSQGGTWYYLNPETKAMATGLRKIDGKRYYFNKSGVMASNRWEKIDYSWYYFTASGAAKKGWMKWGDEWYWFDSTGRGASNEGIHLSDGYHFFDYDGVWVKSASTKARGWIKVVNRTYYYDGDYCDWDTKLYYINSRGELLGVDTNAWSYRIGDYYYDFSRDGAYYRENVYTGESEYWSHHGDCYYYYGCDGCYWASYY